MAVVLCLSITRYGQACWLNLLALNGADTAVSIGAARTNLVRCARPKIVDPKTTYVALAASRNTKGAQASAGKLVLV